MAETQLLIGGFTGDYKYLSPPPIGGHGIRLGLCETEHEDINLRERFRPTGESGSGPYFNAYKTLDSGVSYAVADYNGDICALRMDLTYNVEAGQGTYAWNKCRLRVRAHDNWHIAVSARVYPDCGTWIDQTFQLYAIARVLMYIGPVNGRGTYWYTVLSITKRGDEGMATDINSAVSEAYNELYSRVVRALAGDYSTGYIQQGYNRLGNEYSLGDLSPFSYRYSEYDAFELWRLTGGLPKRYDALWTAAYVDAVDRLPDSDTNSIANIVELLSSINKLRKGKLDSPKTWKDLWLSYRYSYCTTKSDIEAYAELTRRLCALSKHDAISSFGFCESEGITCRSSIKVLVSDIFPDLSSFAEKYGLTLSNANIWDMVPYSFIADWFLHIGDIISWCETRNWAITLPVQESWVSFSTSYDNQSVYFRVDGRPSLKMPYVNYKQSSGKTIAMRILDTIALFF